MPSRKRSAGGDVDPVTRVAIVTLGCARNEVDSEELAHRLQADGLVLVDDPDQADAVLVNTCGFVDAAKKDSIDTLMEVSTPIHPTAASGQSGPKVIAVGCLAERYGRDLAESLPEAAAVLSFDDYPEITQRVRAVLSGATLTAHAPSDRRRLLPLAPVDRPTTQVHIPGHGRAGASEPTPGGAAWEPPVLRRRLAAGPVAPIKLASGCDRRCTFCAIPSFRGSFVSRPPADILAEAAWLARDGVREVVLVSENSTSYGKDLGDVRSLEALLPELARIEGIDRIRVAYLQPAEVRVSLVDAMAETAEVADYFDLSFQHASGPVLRRMRRFGDADSFLTLIEQVRSRSANAGIRSNVIVGFPGETESDLATLVDFLQQARLDAIGVFGYSDEEGTAAASFDGKLSEGEIRDRVSAVASVAEEVMAQRAADRVGEHGVLLVQERIDGADGYVEGRLAHQGPDDGSTVIAHSRSVAVGDLIACTVTDSDGVDLVAETR